MTYMCICISAQTRFMIFAFLNFHSDISGSMDGVPTLIEEASTIPKCFYKKNPNRPTQRICNVYISLFLLAAMHIACMSLTLYRSCATSLAVCQFVVISYE